MTYAEQPDLDLSPHSVDEEYDVEAIVDEVTMNDGRKFYEVKWLGYDEPTWEPEEHLNCPEKLEAFFLSRRPEQRKKTWTSQSTIGSSTQGPPGIKIEDACSDGLFVTSSGAGAVDSTVLREDMEKAKADFLHRQFLVKLKTNQSSTGATPTTSDEPETSATPKSGSSKNASSRGSNKAKNASEPYPSKPLSQKPVSFKPLSQKPVSSKPAQRTQQQSVKAATPAQTRSSLPLPPRPPKTENVVSSRPGSSQRNAKAAAGSSSKNVVSGKGTSQAKSSARSPNRQANLPRKPTNLQSAHSDPWIHQGKGKEESGSGQSRHFHKQPNWQKNSKRDRERERHEDRGHGQDRDQEQERSRDQDQEWEWIRERKRRRHSDVWNQEREDEPSQDSMHEYGGRDQGKQRDHRWNRSDNYERKRGEFTPDRVHFQQPPSPRRWSTGSPRKEYSTAQNNAVTSSSSAPAKTYPKSILKKSNAYVNTSTITAAASSPPTVDIFSTGSASSSLAEPLRSPEYSQSFTPAKLKSSAKVVADKKVLQGNVSTEQRLLKPLQPNEWRGVLSRGHGKKPVCQITLTPMICDENDQTLLDLLKDVPEITMVATVPQTYAYELKRFFEQERSMSQALYVVNIDDNMDRANELYKRMKWSELFGVAYLPEKSPYHLLFILATASKAMAEFSITRPDELFIAFRLSLAEFEGIVPYNLPNAHGPVDVNHVSTSPPVQAETEHSLNLLPDKTGLRALSASDLLQLHQVLQMESDSWESAKDKVPERNLYRRLSTTVLLQSIGVIPLLMHGNMVSKNFTIICAVEHQLHGHLYRYWLEFSNGKFIKIDDALAGTTPVQLVLIHQMSLLPNLPFPSITHLKHKPSVKIFLFGDPQQAGGLPYEIFQSGGLVTVTPAALLHSENDQVLDKLVEFFRLKKYSVPMVVWKLKLLQHTVDQLRQAQRKTAMLDQWIENSTREGLTEIISQDYIAEKTGELSTDEQTHICMRQLMYDNFKDYRFFVVIDVQRDVWVTTEGVEVLTFKAFQHDFMVKS